MKTNMHYGATPGVFANANQLRKNPTRAEEILWKYLCKNQIGYRLRRQHPIWLYVADFYCHSLKLVIEVDGGIHENIEIQLNDREKEDAFLNLGLTVIRFTNEQVCSDIDNVLSCIYSKIEEIKNQKFPWSTESLLK